MQVPGELYGAAAEAEAFARLLSQVEGVSPSSLGLAPNANTETCAEYSSALISGLARGQRDFARKREHLFGSPSHALSHVNTASKGIAFIRKSTVNVTRRLREVERDCTSLQRQSLELQEEVSR